MTRVVLSLSTAVMFSSVGAVVPLVAVADHTTAHTIEQLTVQIAALQAQILALQGGAAAPAGKCNFTRDLSQGSQGDDVKCLQKYLNSKGFTVASSGAGSSGSETTFFGAKTKAAVAQWQSAHGVSPSVGYFGPRSRAKYNELVAGVAPAPTPTPGVPAGVGTGLTVSGTTQPGDSLAPLNAARVPVTKFTLTASADGDIQVNSVTIERQGPAADASVSSLVLIGEDGLQIGTSKTLNSNHQAVLNEKFTVKAGTSKTITVGLNRPSSGSDGGDIAKFAIVAVDAGSTTVSGSLPIVGSPITMNSTLTIGAFGSGARGVQDPGANQTKEIGTKGYIFTAVRFTAGSAEDVNVKWASFNQSGSAATSDLKNTIINAGGTDYPVIVSADGKYYTAKFGDSGIDVKKGDAFEFYVKGDIENGSNRGVDFDLYRYTDIYVVGKSFGFGITPAATDSGDSATDDDGTFQATNPNWDAYEATIGNGTITVTASTAAPAQNIAVNLANQPLGAFDVDVKGESVTVSSMVIRVSSNRNDSSVTEADYTQVALYDNTTGKVVAGPKDGSGTADGQMIFTFTDAVTFPIGKRAYVLKGKLSTDFDTDTLISASSTPNSDWTSIKGDISGASITAANTGTVSGNSMTVKAGSAIVSLASSPQTQTVIRGVKGFTFANIIVDATASGEDVRFTSLGVQHNYAVAGDITNCQLFDGTTALNTGTNIINPAAAASAALKDNTFTLDNNLTVARNTSKTVALKCDVNLSGTGAYAQWTFSSNESFGATGLTSGNSITPAVASSTVTNLMTFSGSGSFTVTLDTNPAVALATAGQEVDVLRLRLAATNEAVDVKQISFLLTNVASNTPNDLQKLTVWDGITKVGEVTATSSDTGLVATISGLNVPKDSDKTVVVKALLAPICTNCAGRPGHLLTIDYDNVNIGGNNATYGTGVDSSANIYPTSADTASNGIRILRAYPTVSVQSIPSSSLADATQKVLYRFTISAPAGLRGISLYKFTFSVATSGDDAGAADVTITNLRLFGYANSNYSGAYFGAEQLNSVGTAFFSADGGNDAVEGDRATTTDYAIYFAPSSSSGLNAEAIYIRPGETVYFQLVGDVTGADSGDTATVQLLGDGGWYGVGSSTAALSPGPLTYADEGFLAGSITYGFATTAPRLDEADAGQPAAGSRVGDTGTNANDPDAGDDFIWSGNSTTTHNGANDDSGPDWYNGFKVPGLPEAGATAVTLSL